MDLVILCDNSVNYLLLVSIRFSLTFIGKILTTWQNQPMGLAIGVKVRLVILLQKL